MMKSTKIHVVLRSVTIFEHFCDKDEQKIPFDPIFEFYSLH